jgi:hypothetical protein
MLATVEYWKQIIHHYLTYEQLTHHLIQLMKEESTEYKIKGLVPWNSGYH